MKDLGLYRGWRVTYDKTRPVTGTWRGERFGVGMCNNSEESLLRMIRVKNKEEEHLRMIDYQSVACTATFMAFGMFEVDSKNRQRGPDGRSTHDIYTVWDKGAVELHFELAQYAELSEKISQFFVDRDHDFPGVYDYEVSEPFGMWFAEFLFARGDTPPISVATDWLVEQAMKFFRTSGECGYDTAVLRAQIMEHLK